MIKEKDLIKLGFERQDDYFYYYTLDIEDFCLITNTNDEVKDDSWKVYIFDYAGFEFTELEKLKLFIDVLKSAVK